jgi:amino acid transporter
MKYLTPYERLKYTLMSPLALYLYYTCFLPLPFLREPFAICRMICMLRVNYYYSAVPKEEIRSSSLLTAALFFEKVFGNHASARVLPALVAISAIGNILAVAIGHTRIIREVARQGVLPWASFWTSTYPFASPGGPVLISFVLSTIVVSTFRKFHLPSLSG